MIRTAARYEPVFFSLLLILQLMCVWIPPFFITLDGPGHAYNIFVLDQLLSSDHSVFDHWYALNTSLSPNWIGHAIVLPFSEFLSAAETEQVLVSLGVVSLAMGYRFFVISSGFPGYLSSLVFFFTMNHALLNGFMNYSIGLGFMLLSLSIVIRVLRHGAPGNFLRIGVVSVLLFFSHWVAYGLLVIFVLIFCGTHAFFLTRKSETEKRKQYIIIGKVGMSMLPSLVLAAMYYLSDHQSVQKFYMSSAEIWDLYVRQLGLMAYSERESSYFRWLGIAVVLSAVIAISVRAAKKDLSFESLDKTTLYSLLLCILFIFTASWVLPDGTSGGGILISRLVLVFFLFLCTVWLGMIRIAAIQMGAILVLGYVASDRCYGIYQFQQTLKPHVSALYEMCEIIPDNALVVPVNFNTKWPLHHSHAYVARDRGFILTDILGGQKIFSPLRWKGQLFTDAEMECFADNAWRCQPNTLEQVLSTNPDYWLCLGQPESQDQVERMSLFWEPFFRDSCQLVKADSVNLIFVYRRIQS